MDCGAYTPNISWSFDRLTLTTNLKELNRKAKEETPKSFLSSLLEAGFIALFTYFVLRNIEFPEYIQMQIKRLGRRHSQVKYK